MPRRTEATIVEQVLLAAAAETIGVTPQRAYQLACRHRRFPVKVVEGRVALADLDAFAEYADRRAAHLVATEDASR